MASSRKLGVVEKQIIPLSIFPPEVRELLNVFDADGSGSIDPSELAAAAKRARDDQKMLTRYRWLAVVGVVLFVILSAMQFGVSLAAVSLAKESHVTGATMTTLGGSVVQTANSEFVVGKDGVARQRNSTGPIAVSVHSRVVSLNSDLPDDVFVKMISITLTSQTNATLTSIVQGFVRGEDGSAELILPIGTVRISGSQTFFSNTDALSDVFAANGFISAVRQLHSEGGPRFLVAEVASNVGTTSAKKD